MIHPDEALALISALHFPERVETVPLSEALHRVLCRELASPIDQPPFDKSAMDGFAHSGPPGALGTFRVDSILPAGRVSTVATPEGACVRIMTGAPLPPGAACVQRLEYTEEAGSNLVSFSTPENVDNVIRRGENLRSGEILLEPGRLEARHIGILASAGFDAVPLARAPLVGVLSTGDELRSPGEALVPGAIYDSNGPQLLAQAQAAGARILPLGRIGDDATLLEAAIGRALETCDLLILSGGVSMGDFDFVPRVLERNGVMRIFHGVAMKPGKPTWFGRRGDAFVFGMPGNPVSTFVNFEVFVRPLLARMQGIRYEPTVVPCRLGQGISRRLADRVEWFPAKREGDRVLLLRYGGSSALQALAKADCLVRLELGQLSLEEGSEIDARLL